MDAQSIISKLQAEFPKITFESFPGGAFLPAEELHSVAEFCNTNVELDMQVLTSMTAVDYSDYIELVYHLISYSQKHDLVLKAKVSRERPEIETVEDIWKTANWQERECFDLFGVIFKHHSDLRRIMLPDDWIGHPLRKDYVAPTEYHGMTHVRKNPLIPEGQTENKVTKTE